MLHSDSLRGAGVILFARSSSTPGQAVQTAGMRRFTSGKRGSTGEPRLRSVVQCATEIHASKGGQR